METRGTQEKKGFSKSFFDKLKISFSVPRMSRKISTLTVMIIFLSCASGRSAELKKEDIRSEAGSGASADDFRNRTVKDSVLIETELNRKSQEYFDQLYRSVDYDRLVEDDRLTLMKKVANKLSVAMGYGYYNESNIYLVKYKKDTSALNAFVLPTGQIFVFEALVDLLKQKARENSNGSADDEQRILENLLAAVIGHEIGHYYGKHQLKSELRKLGNLSSDEKLEKIKKTDLSKAQILIDDIENEQNYEIQSDWFAVTAMAKAGYEPGFLESLLYILKEYVPDRNPYLSTHPSMNRRIAYISKDPEKQKNLVDRIVRLEYAFAAVETGYKLDDAAIAVKQELDRMPDNPYLLSALAKIYHRIWEKSCEISELRFKSSIIYSPFQEGMIHSVTRGKEGLKRKFWCSRSDYETSLQYYRDAIKNFAGHHTLTSYAVLLSYHPDKEQYSSAVIYARRAFEEISEEDSIGKLRALNNLAIVFFMNEKFEDSVSLFSLAARGSIEKLSAGQFDPVADKVIRSLSGKNTGILLEAFYNLGAVYKELS
ncbi:MAG TPA: M48 family metallopeptidase, partial [Leptospiraceae bacterium]|nr:M48 family metallopeptidase [Leptospiraceae bacterium]